MIDTLTLNHSKKITLKVLALEKYWDRERRVFVFVSASSYNIMYHLLLPIL